MTQTAKEEAKALIQRNILSHGHHVYLVSQGVVPRFVYTVGLSKKIGIELLLAGASFYDASEAVRLVNDIAYALRSNRLTLESSFNLHELGIFALREVDQSWVRLLLLGALDFYGVQSVRALQIVPDDQHMTIDVPDVSRPWDPAVELVWRWLEQPWDFSIPKNSRAVTNLAALRGARITEASRWEGDEWEIFAGSGPDTAPKDVRIVPIATLLAADSSLEKVIALDIGKSLWRNADELEWNDWQ